MIILQKRDKYFYETIVDCVDLLVNLQILEQVFVLWKNAFASNVQQWIRHTAPPLLTDTLIVRASKRLT